MEERNVRKHNSNTHFVSTYQLCESQVRGHTMEKERNIANINTTTILTLSVLTICVSHRVRGHTMEERNIANINTTTIHNLSVLTICVSHRYMYKVTQWRRRETLQT